MIKRILYLGWLGRANVGDEVLYQIFKRGILEACDEAGVPFLLEIDAWQSHKNYEQSVHFYDLVVLGGGSIFHIGHWLSICAEAQKHGIKTVAWGTGVDALEKKTISYLPPANREMVVAVAGRMEYLSCRGAFSKDWLQQHLPNRDIRVIGDPALNYQPPMQDSHQRSSLVYLNWGTSNGQIFGSNEKQLENHVAKAVKALCERGLKFVIVPLWVEDVDPCRKLSALINHENVQHIPNVLAADRLFGVLQQCRLAIAFKLHAAILSAAAGCLPVSLAYRFKCIEFMASIGFDDVCLPTDEVTAQSLVNAVGQLNKDYDKFEQILRDAKKQYSSELHKSFSNIFSVLST